MLSTNAALVVRFASVEGGGLSRRGGCPSVAADETPSLERTDESARFFPGAGDVCAGLCWRLERVRALPVRAGPVRSGEDAEPALLQRLRRAISSARQFAAASGNSLYRQSLWSSSQEEDAGRRRKAAPT